jgi:hypothetical protein
MPETANGQLASGYWPEVNRARSKAETNITPHERQRIAGGKAWCCHFAGEGKEDTLAANAARRKEDELSVLPTPESLRLCECICFISFPPRSPRSPRDHFST